jgi:1-acyl-sn-glycerol-3-phosphate acyltransferase
MSQWILSLFGWKIVGQLPATKKYVLIVAPHTSNWDLIIGLLARFAVKTRIHFLAKKEIFVFPLKQFFEAVGGTPVDRSQKANRVDQLVEVFNTHEHYILGLAPEGTRSPVSRWKFGFYHIANKANVPIVMVGMDYPSREVRIAPEFQPSGDVEADYDKMIDFFKGIQGKVPKTYPPYRE